MQEIEHLGGAEGGVTKRTFVVNTVVFRAYACSLFGMRMTWPVHDEDMMRTHVVHDVV